MTVRNAAVAKTPQKAQRELEDLQLVLRARNGDNLALDALIRRYTTFVRELERVEHREPASFRLGERLDEETRARLERLRRGQ